MPYPIKLATVCFLAAMLGACASPPSRFYALSSPTTAVGVSGETAGSLSVAVGPVTLPELVDRPQIVLNVGENQVRLDEFNRWASPLQDNIARVIVNNLTQELATARVWPYAQTTQATPDTQVLIDIQQFESALGGVVTIEASWTVRKVGGAAKTGRSLVREPTAGADFDALVAAHSRALARVSGDIATVIRAP
jgi:uncharacterized lipoprotein YmbA